MPLLNSGDAPSALPAGIVDCVVPSSQSRTSHRRQGVGPRNPWSDQAAQYRAPSDLLRRVLGHPRAWAERFAGVHWAGPLALLPVFFADQRWFKQCNRMGTISQSGQEWRFAQFMLNRSTRPTREED